MRRTAAFAATLVALTHPAWAMDSLTMSVLGIAPDATIPVAHVFCQPSATGHSKDGANERPGITWTAGPAGTKSYAVVVEDPDVPAKFDDAYKEGRVIKQDAPRQPFYHWVQIGIPANVRSIPGGASAIPEGFGHSATNDVVRTSKVQPSYAGPCPPWNDERLHHYHFEVLALDLPDLNVAPETKARDVVAALRAHAIASGELVGTYSLNPAVQK